MSLTERAQELQPELVRLRRALHREPELGLDLPRTQEKVLAALDGLPLEITLGKGLSSVTAVLRGGKPGGAVLLRGDMDALPVTEQSGVEYASRVPGAMHACGHDLHTAGLVGAATLLAERREHLQGDVVFMFQPGEEGHNGAGAMIEEGVLDAAGKPLDAAYALHVAANTLPGGWVATRPGTVTSASDRMTVTVRGKGGHGSTPFSAKDPVPVACEIVTAVQTWVTRRFDLFDPAVVTVGTFHAGTQANVIPETATFEATIRSYSETVHERLVEGLPKLVRGIAEAHGVQAEVAYSVEYPVTVNAPDETAFAIDTARDLLGHDVVWQAPNPANGSEDFAFVLQRVPGAMLMVGAAPEGADLVQGPMNHSPLAVFDDAVLARQAVLLSGLAERRLAQGTTA
ncbi:M20 family metallopeptidase [Streptomyces sp. VRA16 Mangrove soil]|uniref:M20 metallopeptidase family protein n=1 Tax=Streptomyces sp. VRA16 Mangrove soil TaxID=2817434 RepID=UPI001A9DF1E9|nr:M20 family metallopeptidase [Streptomyces sp. VRA16 Mangrove soil]MBO1332101.1 amidohydrolase [Streptomyces sp. VRA16 Mangrove soil]